MRLEKLQLIREGPPPSSSEFKYLLIVNPNLHFSLHKPPAKINYLPRLYLRQPH